MIGRLREMEVQLPQKVDNVQNFVIYLQKEASDIKPFSFHPLKEKLTSRFH